MIRSPPSISSHDMRSIRLMSSLNKPSPSSSAAAVSARFSTSCSDDQVVVGGSQVYQQKLKFQRPATIKWRHSLGQLNSASFIGSVLRPLRLINTAAPRGGRFGLHTVLSVRNSPQSETNFRILLKMWDEMAVLSSKHLKPNDFIYVSGLLGSYTNEDLNGNLRLYHELVVKELNYIARHGQGPTPENHEESRSDGGETGLERYRERLHLWQLYFANPYDWWDNRNSKLNSRQPDFKHKDTGEALWLSPNDPPWIKTEIHRLDLRMAEQGEGRQAGYHRGGSKWEYDE